MRINVCGRFHHHQACKPQSILRVNSPRLPFLGDPQSHMAKGKRQCAVATVKGTSNMHGVLCLVRVCRGFVESVGAWY